MAVFPASPGHVLMGHCWLKEWKQMWYVLGQLLEHVGKGKGTLLLSVGRNVQVTGELELEHELAINQAERGLDPLR